MLLPEDCHSTAFVMPGRIMVMRTCISRNADSMSTSVRCLYSRVSWSLSSIIFSSAARLPVVSAVTHSFR